MTRILRVGHIVQKTEAEGPGCRFAVWVMGCPLRCKGCCNPELLGTSGGEDWSTSALLADILATTGIEGISVLGGEPMAQPDAVFDLARGVRAAGLSVMVYTGFTLAELRARNEPAIEGLLAQVDLLVDGPYERERPETKRRWIGSENQVMHFMSGRYSPKDPRFFQENTVEIRWSPGALMVNGWPSAARAVVRSKRPGAATNPRQEVSSARARDEAT